MITGGGEAGASVAPSAEAGLEGVGLDVGAPVGVRAVNADPGGEGEALN